MTALWELAGEAWAAHRHERTHVEGGVLRLAAGATSGALEATLPPATLDRLVVSLNPAGPWAPGARARVRVRARSDGAWTPWAPLGVYGRGDGLPRSEVGPDPALIEVQVDVVRLHRPAEQVAVRVELEGAGAAIRRLALLTWRHGPPAPAPPNDEPPPAWGRDLDVPERSQAVEDPAIAGRICSPTSLAMVLARWGRELPTADVAAAVYDHGAGIYGNWSFNVTFAATLGLDATVARCTSFGPVEDEVAAGRPVVISHRYRAGEVRGAAVTQTDGHLIVIRGFTAEGDVIVNDPAANPRKGEAIRRVYRRADLARSWLGNGSGICYLVRG
ncbi:MAG: C39 family peptidase [Planctomycetes bacterium]|nr:C39 family peptidase [Planctomycetota bacterium]